jgi:pilus assembly protein CpaF
MTLSARPPWEQDGIPMPSAPTPITTTLTEQLAVLRNRGGWDSRLSPQDAWRRILGEVPYPDPLDLAAHPTFGPLDAWLEDLSLTDIHLNGPGRELTARHSGDALELGLRETWLELGLRETWHADWYPWLVQQLCARGRGSATEVLLHGAADATWPGQRPCLLRYEVALPPLCPHGPSLTVRVLRPGQFSLARLVELDVLSATAAELLAGAMRAGADLLIVGLAGAGKTTLAQALLEVVDDQRIICIEDVPEIVLVSQRVVRLDLAAAPNLTFADLARSALRMNAQRIVIGETRGAEAYAVLAAARNGYPVLTTLHGESARHGLQNLAAMALEAQETQASLEVVYATLNARPILLVALSRYDGVRQVAEIVEVQRSLGASAPTIETLFERDDDGLLRAITPLSHALRHRLEAAGALPREAL